MRKSITIVYLDIQIGCKNTNIFETDKKNVQKKYFLIIFQFSITIINLLVYLYPPIDAGNRRNDMNKNDVRLLVIL